MKYAHYEQETGKLLGWYDSEIHFTEKIVEVEDTDLEPPKPEIIRELNIPKPNIQVTDEQWQEAINNNYNYVNVEDKTLSFKDFRTFEELQVQKRNEIRSAYQKAADDPVIAIDITWNGGMDSAMKLDGAKRLAELCGQDHVTFYDIENSSHSLTMKQADEVIKEVGIAFQTALAKKQGLFKQITQADNKELELIKW